MTLPAFHAVGVAAAAFSIVQRPGAKAPANGGRGAGRSGSDGAVAAPPATGTIGRMPMSLPGPLDAPRAPGNSGCEAGALPAVGMPPGHGHGADASGGLGASVDGRALLVTVGQDAQHTVAVWESPSGLWDDAVLVAKCEAGAAAVAFSVFCAGTANDGAHLAVGGDGFLSFYRVAEGSLRRLPGSFAPRGQRQPLTCASVVAGRLITGTGSGQLYVWQGRQCTEVLSAHADAVTCMHSTGDTLVSGGADAVVRLWATGSGRSMLRCITTVELARFASPAPLNPAVRAVCLRSDAHRSTVAIGVASGEVFELARPGGGCHGNSPEAAVLADAPVHLGAPSETGKVLPSVHEARMARSDLKRSSGAGSTISSVRRVHIDDAACPRLVSGHAATEACGLAPHPLEPDVLATVGDDATLRLWSRSKRVQVGGVALPGPARAVAWSPDGCLLAVGLGARWGPGGARGAGAEDGMLLVLEASRLTVLYHGREARLPIGCLAFSPDGLVLAVGSYDAKVYLYAVSSGVIDAHQASSTSVLPTTTEVNLRGICEGCAGRVVAMDFDETSQFLQANDSEGQLLFFSVADGEAMAHPSELRDAKWATHTLPATWATAACWPPPTQPIGQRGSTLGAFSDTEPSAAVADPFREVLVIGDTSGRLQLFRYPAPFKDAIPRVSRGHSGPIRTVRFSADGGHVFALGGPDGCLTQWRLVRGETPQTAPALGPFPILLQPLADAGV